MTHTPAQLSPHILQQYTTTNNNNKQQQYLGTVPSHPKGSGFFFFWSRFLSFFSAVLVEIGARAVQGRGGGVFERQKNSGNGPGGGGWVGWLKGEAAETF